jgi:hypothetical protein
MLHHAYREGRAFARASRRDDISREEKNVGRPTKKVLSAKEKKSENIKNRGPKKHHSFLSFSFFLLGRKKEE